MHFKTWILQLIINVYNYIECDMVLYIPIMSLATRLKLPQLATKTLYYHIVGMFGGGKFGEFDESSVISQTKTIQISSCN